MQQDVFGLFMWVFRRLENPAAPSYQLTLSVLDNISQVTNTEAYFCHSIDTCIPHLGQKLQRQQAESAGFFVVRSHLQQSAAASAILLSTSKAVANSSRNAAANCRSSAACSCWILTLMTWCVIYSKSCWTLSSKLA